MTVAFFRARKRGTSKPPSQLVETSDHTIRILTDALDESSAPALAAAARMLLARGGRHLTVDLSAVTHIDAEGAAVLLVLARKMGGPDGMLTLVGLQDEQPAQRLDRTGLFTLAHVVLG